MEPSLWARESSTTGLVGSFSHPINNPAPGGSLPYLAEPKSTLFANTSSPCPNLSRSLQRGALALTPAGLGAGKIAPEQEITLS